VNHRALRASFIRDRGHDLREVDLLERRERLLRIFLQLELCAREDGSGVVLLL
jgi:hypothetical protein